MKVQLYDLCYNYIENCNYQSFSLNSNEKIYNLCVEYIFGTIDISSTKRNILLSYFSKDVLKYGIV